MMGGERWLVLTEHEDGEHFKSCAGGSNQTEAVASLQAKVESGELSSTEVYWTAKLHKELTFATKPDRPKYQLGSVTLNPKKRSAASQPD